VCEGNGERLLQRAAAISEILIQCVRQIGSAGRQLPDPNGCASERYIMLAESFSAERLDPLGETLEVGIHPLACKQFGRQHEPSDAEAGGPEELPARHVLVIQCHGGSASFLDLG
jgi:hypothetical protein